MSRAKSLESYLEALQASGVDGLVFPSAAGKTIPASHRAIATDAKAASDSSPKNQLLTLRDEVLNCIKCQELAGTRKSVVFGSGNARAKLVFVGEAPGFDEDAQGLPFVGKAGQLLTKMIEAIGMTRQGVFICNVLKCRPPQNRNPKPEEVINCSPYLWAQLDLIRPQLICALGNFASQTLLQTTKSISQLRGGIHDARGFRVICTFHPAYLLRSPADKTKAWEDLKRVRRELVGENSV